MIHHGDCVEVMAAMPENSVDAIVCDPPYGLEFMGKEWDRIGALAGADKSYRGGYGWHGKGASRESNVAQEEWHQRWATAAFRVAKPGAYLLAFGGTRTSHRLACAIEDAGWIIRDTLVWAYASGFPKSKATLKPAWEPIVMARKPGPLRELAIDACRIPADPNDLGDPARFATGKTGEGTWNANDGGIYDAGRRGGWLDGKAPAGRWPANIILTDPVFDGGWDGVVGGGETGKMPGNYERTPVNRSATRIYGGGDGIPDLPAATGFGDTGTYSRFFALPGGTGCYLCGAASSAAWSSSQPSPSGASAPDHAVTEASSAADTTTDSPTTSGTVTPFWSEGEPPTSRTAPSPGSRRNGRTQTPSPASSAEASATSSGTTTTTRGRWTCASCVDAVMRSFMGEPESDEPLRAYLIPKASRSDREPNDYGKLVGGLEERVTVINSNGEPSNFMGPKSCSRCGEKWIDQDGLPRCRHGKEFVIRSPQHIPRSNVHPTVKPVELMRHLVRLVTPQGGTVLDPFLGSGTTALAAEQEGFAWIGIEREAEYVKIAEARLAGAQRGLGLSA